MTLTNGSKILVTGGAGYIGSHTVMALQEAGYSVLILDNLVFGHRDFVENVLQAEFICGDVGDRNLLQQIFATHDIAAVIHFAAYTYVRESVEQPSKYYQNNVVATLTLLEEMVAAGVKQLVFSSTCATYGLPQWIPLTEEHPQVPINPYGTTKLIGEQLINDFSQAYQLRAVCFRYFNAAGADKKARLGEDRTPETHLIPLVLMAAAGKRDCVYVYGTDYDTLDGTGIRDYLHVVDLAQAHILGLEYLLQGGKTDAFNLGNGNGFSVWQVMEAAKAVTGKSWKIVTTDRRSGDPPILVGSAKKAEKILGWQPQERDLEILIEDAWRWYQVRSQ
ncbi:MAG: UDP-glucose 4-epimerase GalE [Calothrix sp. MO_167.B12]|nr:UDP-glucose 4-epimerase GalE [Calothrix sp. MO_167.B12]